MAFVVCGLNHKTAPIDVREKIASSAAEHTLSRQLFERNTVNEITLLTTCNRTELYCDTDEPNNLVADIAAILQYPTDELTQYLYFHKDQEAVHHLMRVAIGLDSMMLGEPQILGQLKRAYQDACEAGTAKSHLKYVFQMVFNATKKIRTQTGVGKNPVSIAYAAAQLITQHFNDLSALNIFIIGSGETASLVAKYLHQQGARQFLIANRTQQHAHYLAQQFNGRALSITDIPQYLPQADVVISATACPLPFINKALVQNALLARDNAFMFLLDLSIPRDIEANVAELNAIRLYNIDDLHTIVGEGMEERRAAAIHAEQLVNQEVAQFTDWVRSKKADAMIAEYRNRMKIMAELELQRAQRKLRSGTCQHTVLSELCERLVNKLTHLPTTKLRQVALDERTDLIDLIQFVLNKTSENATL
jgi:glutamyl-tRNA reductase